MKKLSCALFSFLFSMVRGAGGGEREREGWKVQDAMPVVREEERQVAEWRFRSGPMVGRIGGPLLVRERQVRSSASKRVGKARWPVLSKASWAHWASEMGSWMGWLEAGFCVVLPVAGLLVQCSIQGQQSGDDGWVDGAASKVSKYLEG